MSRVMDFAFFLLVNAVLLIQPAEIVPALALIARTVAK